jgi:hypothetical protein
MLGVTPDLGALAALATAETVTFSLLEYGELLEGDQRPYRKQQAIHAKHAHRRANRQ